MDDILENATFMLLLSKKIGKDWKDLGRFLSLKDSDLDVIDHDYDRLGEKTYRMLCFWRDQRKHPTLDDLASGLHLAKRIDLIKMVEESSKKSFGYEELSLIKPTSKDIAVQVKLPGPSKKHTPIPVCKSLKLLSDHVGSHKDKITASKIFLMEKGESVEVNIVEPINWKDMFIDELIVNDDFPIEKYYLSPNCNLSSNDLLDISAKQLLSNTVIHTMQKMITGVCGLQDPVLGQNLLFNIQKASFVQVLHDGDAHWLAISTFGCSVGEVFLLDSMFCGKVKNHVIRQICAIMHCTEDILTVRVVPVQQQTNNVDCGLYALAFVKHIVDTGSNPSYVAFDDSQMRNHLLQCVKGNQFNAFPKSKTALRFCKEKDFQFSLYCIGRQVWLASENDPDELFCKSLVSSFHNLSKKKNKRAKIKIMEILLEMESDNE